MPDSRTRQLIVDGNNLIHADPDLAALRTADFDAARRTLVQKLNTVAGLFHGRITVVFDRRTPGPRPGFEKSAVAVAFTTPDASADSVIERMVGEAGEPSGVVVVTSDWSERQVVEAAGGCVMSCERFLEWLSGERANLDRRVRDLRRGSPGSRLSDFFPE